MRRREDNATDIAFSAMVVFQALEDSETVEFSPTAEYRAHIEKVARKMAG
jgi:hypothetical protein